VELVYKIVPEEKNRTPFACFRLLLLLLLMLSLSMIAASQRQRKKQEKEMLSVSQLQPPIAIQQSAAFATRSSHCLLSVPLIH
jgi:hypothetical protein